MTSKLSTLDCLKSALTDLGVSVSNREININKTSTRDTYNVFFNENYETLKFKDCCLVAGRFNCNLEAASLDNDNRNEVVNYRTSLTTDYNSNNVYGQHQMGYMIFVVSLTTEEIAERAANNETNSTGISDKDVAYHEQCINSMKLEIYNLDKQRQYLVNEIGRHNMCLLAK